MAKSRGLEAETSGARDRIIDALLGLAGESAWHTITISDIAGRAGISLAEFRTHFPSKGAILGAFSKRIDTIVLQETTGDLDAESARERLFDILMRRIDALAPHKDSIRSIIAGLRHDPLNLLAMNQVASNSMRFMLEAAGIETEGPLGSIKVQGAVLSFAYIVDVWLRDDDAGLSRTMAALDRELGKGAMMARRLDDFGRMSVPLATMMDMAMERGRSMWDSRIRNRHDPDLDPGT
ncbi:MAG: TetR/AcrR family transcriptional regulator [Hyphomicrobiales bacterium]